MMAPARVSLGREIYGIVQRSLFTRPATVSFANVLARSVMPIDHGQASALPDHSTHRPP